MAQIPTVVCKYCQTVSTKRLRISIKSFYCSVCTIQSYCPQNKQLSYHSFTGDLYMGIVQTHGGWGRRVAYEILQLLLYTLRSGSLCLLIR